MTISKATYVSPVGELLIAWRGDRLVSLDYADYAERFQRLLDKRFERAQFEGRSSLPPFLQTALEQYFAGRIDAVDTVAVEYGGTGFENQVWPALREIAAGATATYGELAAKLGAPNAARAVGRANSMNPVAIVVPCHRVIGASGKLTGYAGGLERKQWLLEHERKHGAGIHREIFAAQSLF